uniref:Uncharacterized protein n=1 Tax=Ananas comosus var. bracteatus TaxID=296719 RepID=A0A6V7Q0N5_ANACO|nr:unnamed protein product [Ananas comosus var. bracteatus]
MRLLEPNSHAFRRRIYEVLACACSLPCGREKIAGAVSRKSGSRGCQQQQQQQQRLLLRLLVQTVAAASAAASAVVVCAEIAHDVDSWPRHHRAFGDSDRIQSCLNFEIEIDQRFEGPIPAALFNRPLDAIFLNSNSLRRPIPANLGDSPASVVVLAHNQLGGCIPPSIGRMADTLNEIVLLDDGLAACVPPEVGLLRRLTVLDVSFNLLQGSLPSSLSGAADLQQLDVAHNRLTGAVPEAVCALPSSLLLRPLSSSRMRRMRSKA